jgi:glucose-1-phosphate cytidylyltransferase
MMPVGGKPIVVRVMQIFANQGYKDFILSIGYRKEIILDYFEGRSNGWSIDLVDTGEDADTAERIYRCRDRLGDCFFVTYSDGLCDIKLDRLLQFHTSHDGAATITNVALRSQYGTIDADATGRVLAFKEKPILREHRINAGFFVMNKHVFDIWEGRNLEREVFPALLARNMLYSYQHDGFFKSMDTFKDQQELEEMFERGEFDWIQRRPELTGGAAFRTLV